MKRFFAVLGSLLVLPAFAEVAPVYYDEIVEYTDEMIDAIDEAEDASVAQQQNVTSRTTTNRTTLRSGGATRSTTQNRPNLNAVKEAQKNANRGTVSRTARVQPTQKVTSRSAATRQSVTSRAGQTNSATKARVSANTNVVPVVKTSSSAGRVTNVTTDGSPLYYSTTGTAVTPRVGVASRRATARISTPASTIVTDTDIATTTSNLDTVAELTEYCQAQYAACMDNYCNVLDDNQGRCSCSKNLKNYQKVEEALATATENFQDAVQKIKYIGLTADQVTSLFAETEAELQMKSSSDSSQLKNSLDSIKKKIIDANATSSTSYATSAVSLNVSGLLDFDLASGFDLSSFLNMNATTGNSSSVSNQRGEQLYKTAAARCKTSVLNACTAQGIEASVITNAYDLEIDKQCIAYERALNEANDEMRNNVRNATTILQQARLMLAQNKNSYDFRGCVAAIDSCMQDEYVCGADYELCLDPTGKYISDGEIIKGGTPGVSGGTVKQTKKICEGTQTPAQNGCLELADWTSEGMHGLYAVWDYKSEANTLNAFGGGVSENLGAYIDEKLASWEDDYNKTTISSDDMATSLLQKIGYIDSDDKVHGMCASVMKQCQDYTYSNKNKKNYLPNNEIVRQYLASTLNRIKSQQDAILSDYAEDCRSDVTSCLSTNGYDETNTQTTASKTAINACRSEIQTCMSVSGYHPADSTTMTTRVMSAWVETLLKNCAAGYYLEDNGTGNVECKVCPTDVTVVSPSAGNPSKVNLESNGGQTTMCHCPSGYSDYSLGSDGQPNKCIESN